MCVCVCGVALAGIPARFEHAQELVVNTQVSFGKPKKPYTLHGRTIDCVKHESFHPSGAWRSAVVPMARRWPQQKALLLVAFVFVVAAAALAEPGVAPVSEKEDDLEQTEAENSKGADKASAWPPRLHKGSSDIFMSRRPLEEVCSVSSAGHSLSVAAPDQSLESRELFTPLCS